VRLRVRCFNDNNNNNNNDNNTLLTPRTTPAHRGAKTLPSLENTLGGRQVQRATGNVREKVH